MSPPSTPPERPSLLVQLGRFLGLIGPAQRPGFPPQVPPDPAETGDAPPEGAGAKLGRFMGLSQGAEADPRPDVAALRAEVDSLRGDVRRLERRLRQVEREV